MLKKIMLTVVLTKRHFLWLKISFVGGNRHQISTPKPEAAWQHLYFLEPPIVNHSP
jgi:hypothetical protein